MFCGCIGAKPFSEEIKYWIPLLIISALWIVLPIVLGGSIMWTLISWGVFIVTNCLMCWGLGRFNNYGWFPAYVKTKKRLEGRTAIVTGANSGTGYQTAKELVRRGCDVIITCRSQEKAEKTIDKITKDLSKNNNSNDKLGNLSFVILDLCSKKSIDAAIETILSKNVEISILINNAGAWIMNPRITEDGMDAQWESNYMAPFYLTQKLLPNIKATAKKYQFGRICNLVSIGHMTAVVENFEAFYSDEQRGNLEYWASKASVNVYGDAKCALILYTAKLQELLNAEKDSDGKSVGSYLYACSVQPGFINSGFMNLSTRPLVVRIMYPIFYPFQVTFSMVNPWQGAQTTLHCALSDQNIAPGRYHAHCSPQETKKAARPVIDTQKDKLYEQSVRIWPYMLNT